MGKLVKDEVKHYGGRITQSKSTTRFSTVMVIGDLIRSSEGVKPDWKRFKGKNKLYKYE